MKNQNNINNIELRYSELVYGGGYTPEGDLVYDVFYLLGYGFGWISNYIGNHAATYGLAFK